MYKHRLSCILPVCLSACLLSICLFVCLSFCFHTFLKPGRPKNEDEAYKKLRLTTLEDIVQSEHLNLLEKLQCNAGMTHGRRLVPSMTHRREVGEETCRKSCKNLHCVKFNADLNQHTYPGIHVLIHAVKLKLLQFIRRNCL